jgi:hypothetical protein
MLENCLIFQKTFEVLIPSAWIVKHSIFVRKNAMWQQLFKLEQNQMSLEEVCRPQTQQCECLKVASCTLINHCKVFVSYFESTSLHARFLSKLKDPFNITCKPFVIWIFFWCVTLEVLCEIGLWTFLNFWAYTLGLLFSRLQLSN